MGQLGRFTLEEELGRGTMGTVYRSVHPRLRVPVAIKVMSPRYSADPAFRRRFQREASAIAGLNHPGVVRVFDLDDAGGSFFIVMELVEGHNLRDWMRRGGLFTTPVGIGLIRQVLLATGAAHRRGIIHLDLKPENLILSGEGRIKILDFGIAALREEGAPSEEGAISGTPAYMAPEQCQGQKPDRRTDIYAIGILLHELLSGRPPFQGSVPAVLRAQLQDQPQPSEAIPGPIMKVIWRAMAKDPEQRFPNCERFIAALSAQASPTLRLSRQEVPEASPRQSGERRGQGLCLRTGCTRTEGWQCAYQDQAKNLCKTWWCKEHVEFVDGIPLCRRHATVMRAVRITAGTIHEVKFRPAVDDRSFSLAARVCEAADRPITELLRGQFGTVDGLEVVADLGLRQGRGGRRETVWERSWSVLHRNSYFLRLTIRVAVERPTVVQILDGTEVVELVPDWITNRPEGRKTGPQDRARFQERVLEAVRNAVARAQIQPEAPAAPRGRKRPARN